tara:strand:+ start:149 stop:337 length:189 start_codon:yes stop_codon:yes gene_type:complete
MTDEQIIAALKAGETLTFGCNGHNSEVMELMAGLHERGFIELEDMGLEQETRMTARWIGKQP